MLEIKVFTFSPLHENTYILYNEKGECCIIDPGCYGADERDELTNFIAEKNLRPILLLNTHCHPDHVFGLKYVAEQYQLTPHIHRNEKDVLKNVPMFALKWGLVFENYEGELKYLQEGQQIFIGNDELRVVFAPGHSPGHVCFYCAAQGFIINGDVLFYLSVGRTDLPGCSHQALMESIKNQLFTLPDATVVYTGHFQSTTIGFEKLNNPYVR